MDRNWHEYNWANAHELQRLIAEHEWEELPMPIDLNNRELGTVAPTRDFATIRDRANGNPVGKITKPQHASRTVETEPGGSYHWRQYIFDHPTSTMPSGWIADSEYVAWAKDAVQPEPEPEPEPTPEPEPEPQPEPPMPLPYGPLLKSWQEMLRVEVSMRQQLIAMLQEEIDKAEAA